MEPQETSLPANTTENRGWPVRSLYTAPMLERKPSGNPDSMHFKGSKVSVARHSRDPVKTHKEKDQGESLWNPLLSMLKKTRKGSNEELEVAHELPALVPFGDVVGCLAIHIKNCRHFTPLINFQYYDELFIHISINKIVKNTKLYSLPSKIKEKNIVIKFDEVKYFSIQIPRRHDDERNNICVELMHYDSTHKSPVSLGNVQIHLYEVIQKGCFTEEFHMLNKNAYICRLEMEFTFSYGNFGYGFSHQLKPLQKIIEPSMFMSTAPPPERTDPTTNVIMPQPVEYPAFLSPDLNVTVGTPTVQSPNPPPAVKLEKLQQPPRERLEKMKKEYRNLNTWMEKVGYLENIITPKLGHEHTEETNENEVLKSRNNDKSKEKLKNIDTLEPPLIKVEAEPTPNQLLDNADRKSLTIPTLKLSQQENSAAIATKSEESTPSPTDSLLSLSSSLEIIENNDIPPFFQHPSEVMPERKEKNLLYLPEVKLKDKYLSVLKTESSPSEVAFSPKENNSPSFRPEYIEFKPKFQFQKFNKDGFDPFLRNINQKMSVRIKTDQDIYKYRNILSTEVIEHEDQDPPYPSRSKIAGPTTYKTWGCDPNSVTGKMFLDTKNNLAHDPTVNTEKILGSKNKVKETLPNIALPCFKGESSVAGNGYTCRLSKSLSLTSHIENLKQSMLLKSILSKNLQDLSDKLFSKPELGKNTEARKKSNSPLLSIHDKPSNSREDRALDRTQDLNSQISEKDILNSKVLLSQLIKNIPAGSLPEGGPEKSLEERVSEKHSEADMIDFPVKKKSSFKKKHLISETSSPKSGLSGNVHECFINQIFTAPNFLTLETAQSSTPLGRSSSSHSPIYNENTDDEIELPHAQSVISQIIQAFPVNTLLESGIIKVIELDEEKGKSTLLSTEIAIPEEKLKNFTKDYPEIKTELLSEQTIPIISKDTSSSVNIVELPEESQNIPPQDSRYHSTSEKETSLPSRSQWLDREENDLNSTLGNLANSLMGSKLSDETMLKSFLKNVINSFFEYNQSERIKQPEKELEKLIQQSFPDVTEHLEEIPENIDETDKLDRTSILGPKLRGFLEELSESEVKNLKSELSKQIQHYLVERLSESGHIAREDLPKIYQNLYLMNEKAEPKGQNIFQEKYSETVKEIMSFVNNFNHNFIDKHLEIKLRSFLNEILQSYFLKNLSESNLFNEKESETIHSSISSLKSKSASVSLHELGQDNSKGGVGRRLEINMKYPLSKPLQNYLLTLSENELLSLKDELSKHLQSLFIEKLTKSGLMTERQLKGVDQHINLLNSNCTPLKYVKIDSPFKDENHSIEDHSAHQNKYPKTDQETASQKAPESKLKETKVIKEEEKEYFPLHSLKDNSLIIKEQKSYRPKEEAKTVSYIRIQSISNKTIQAIPLNKSSERPTDTLCKKQRKEHGFLQLPQAENCISITEIQDPYNWGSKSKTTQSKVSFERTLKPLEKKDHSNICKSTGEEKPDTMLSSYPRIPLCKMPREDEESLNRLTLPSCQTNTLTHFNSETGEKSKFEDQYCQRLKGCNNNNKKHLVTFAPYKQEIQTLYIKPNEIFNEKYAKCSESQLFKYKAVEDKKNLKSFLFPEVLKRENPKPKVQKERVHVAKPKKSFNKIAKILPSTLPATKIHLKKSVPKTLPHWTARKTIHDCSDKFEDLNVTSCDHLTKIKSRTRLLGKSPDDNRNRTKRSARPYTAPEVNKRRENYPRKVSSPRMVSAGLFHINDVTPGYEMRKMQKKKIKRGY
ncbi:LOW QUALITY PROTEIN: cation channel sperm-associated targeting subunit tau [Nycticebus coucang]|uniref:LOW QUALITY PROTEIN: cation channel sperm-associated targeting subunit tau n=1 Tax=Nycticebus coucang TaxID=9470 RepID=UPI00234D60B2|nr:LOW QUALITY PROTEIN: cation channel sperm-associated targeting subunit tau [Nycticebus coucang]